MSSSLGERREVVLREPVSEGPTGDFISEKSYSHLLGDPHCLKTDTERDQLGDPYCHKTDTERDQPESCWGRK